MKRVFKYMGWPWDRPGFTPSKYKPDGRDMVLCINAMSDKGDWDFFDAYAFAEHDKTDYSLRYNVWLFGNPQRLFELLEEALENNIIKIKEN